MNQTRDACIYCGAHTHAPENCGSNAMPDPTPARTVGDQRPPWDLQTMHEIQAIVFAHFGDEIVPEYISAQMDDFIAFCLVHGSEGRTNA